MIVRFVSRVVIGCCLLGIGSRAADQAMGAEPTRVRVVIASDTRLREDLKFLVDQAPQNLRKQWQTLSDTLESFEGGVAVEKPVGIDIDFGGTELNYLVTVPILKWDDRKNGFKQNLVGFGYKISNGPGGLYQLDQAQAGGKKKTTGPAPKPYYFKLNETYGYLAGSTAALAAVPADPLPLLTKAVPGLVDLAAELRNDPAQMAARRATFQELRKQLEAAVKFKRGESEADFEFRKLSSVQSLNEAERFLIESQELAITWTTDAAQSRGLGQVKLVGLPGTSLAESIDLLNQKPSYFANVPFAAAGVLQARVNFAMDPMRSAHSKDLYDKLLPVLKAAMETRPNLNAEGKLAARSALDQLFGMLYEGVALKNLDMIIDAHSQSEGKHTALCAIRSADGRKAVECLEFFPKIRAGWGFSKNVGKHGGADLHTLAIAPHRLEEFQSLFGGEPVIHIATSADAVWAATGVGGLDKLKAALDAVAQPAPTAAPAEFVQVTAKFGPWIDLLDAFRAKEPKPAANDKAALDEDKRRTKIRKYAKDAFANGGDALEAVLRKNGPTVDGELKIGEGILKFLGAGLADFVAENLN